MTDARQEPRKAFRITSGKGFHITFQNGYTVSVQWGWGNYCENRNKPMPSLDDLREGRKSPEGEAGSMDAEVAVWHRDGDLLRLNGWDDTVKGWQTPADVLALLNWAASQPDAKPAALSHETDGGNTK